MTPMQAVSASPRRAPRSILRLTPSSCFARRLTADAGEAEGVPRGRPKTSEPSCHYGRWSVRTGLISVTQIGHDVEPSSGSRTVRPAQVNDALPLTAAQVRALAYVRTVAERERDGASHHLLDRD